MSASQTILRPSEGTFTGYGRVSAPRSRPAGTISARPAGFWADLWSVAARSLRALPREPELLIPSFIFPVFFFAVNIGTLQDFAQRGIPGLDYRAFQLPTAIIFAFMAPC